MARSNLIIANSTPANLAMIGYYRFWLITDHNLTQMVGKNGMNGASVASIANQYSFSRTIENGTAARLAETVTALASVWPTTMRDRAEECISIGEAVGTYSGASKLMWFLKPDGWTPYDSYAAKALRCGYGPSPTKMRQFYSQFEKLQDKTDGLAELVDKIEPRLHVERVLDQFLVLHGMPDSAFKNRRDELLSFVDALPEDFARGLTATSMNCGDIISAGFAQLKLTAAKPRKT